LKKLLILLLFFGAACGSPDYSVNGVGFHMGETMAIKFNLDGRWNSSDKLLNIPKSFEGTWNERKNSRARTY